MRGPRTGDRAGAQWPAADLCAMAGGEQDTDSPLLAAGEGAGREELALGLLLGQVAGGCERIAPQPVNLDRPQFLRPCRDLRLRMTLPVREDRKRSQRRQDADGQDGHHPNKVQ
ncbi:MAG: hypothetical protein LZF60_250053 [Nitrospira sp.]|nr:MAG: hypothetical protein LZF60_250053 [Nitrospira sp.]